MDELSLLYLLTNAPREQKVLLYSADQLKIKYSDEVIIFFEHTSPLSGSSQY